MKLVRVTMAALAFLGAVASAEATKWTRYQASGDGYSIEFPGTPTVRRDTAPSTVGPAPHVATKFSATGYAYLVELTTYASASDPEAMLDVVAAGYGNTGKLRAQTRLKIGTDVARRFDVELRGGKYIAAVLVVTDGTRLYEVYCVTSRGQETSASVKHFINSFALVQH